MLRAMKIAWQDRLQPGRGPCGHPRFCGVTAGAFPAKAGPTEFAFSQFLWMRTMLFSGTGFSREEARVGTLHSAV